MNPINAIPSIDPADMDDLTGMISQSFKKLMQATGGMLPAQIVSYNRNTNIAKVKPLIMVITTLGGQISRAEIAEIPVIQIGGGGFLLNFNLNPGDLGWILVNDRDISLFQNDKKESPPNTFRIKDYADSVFLPHVMLGYTIAEEDANSTVLQSLDGTVKIALANNNIKIQAPTVTVVSNNDLNVTAGTNNTVSGEALQLQGSSSLTILSPAITINSSTQINITAPTVHVVGNITATGDITAHVPSDED